MKTKIIISLVVIALIYFGYKKFVQKTEVSTDTKTTSEGIPSEVQKHLRDFDEGEKMRHAGKEYQVVNGAWQIA